MKHPKSIIWIALIALPILTVYAKAELFPDDGFVPGWKGAPLKKYLSRDQLFAYMDGGAEVYLDYRFTKLEVKEFSGPDQATLTLEIYEFETPQDAYGIFSRDTSGTPSDLGQGGRTSNTLARFWKGNYFVRAFTWQARADLEGVSLKAAQAVAPKIERSDLPVWLNRLVKGDLSPVFLRTEAALTRLVNVSLPGGVAMNENYGVAWISPSAPDISGCAVLAYPDTTSATDVFKGLWNDIAFHAKGSARSQTRGMAALADTLTEGVQRLGSQVIWVPAAKNEVSCGATLDRVTNVLNTRINSGAR